jgi:hypothetical protein
MTHFYQKIQGWFNFQNFYSKMVSKFDNAIFVEVGSWLGRSTTYMAVEIINSKKNIKYYSVDTWEGCRVLKNDPLVKTKQLFDKFLLNIQPVKNYIIPLKMTSIQASTLFDDNSIDFCFIDADHSYEYVSSDIKYWYPKIKINGILGGHDYRGGNGVYQAVNELAQQYNLNIIEFEDNCWAVEKNKSN